LKSFHFADFLKEYGQANPPQLCYKSSDDFVQWQSNFFNQLKKLQGPVPERIPLQAKLIKEVRENDHMRYLYHIQVNTFSTLPVYLLVPHNIKAQEKRPALLALHGHCTLGIDTVAGVRGMNQGDDSLRSYGLFAAQSGYIVVTPAWWGWPGRDKHLEQIGSQRDRCNVIQMAASMYGINVLTLHLQDAQAAVDFLYEQEQVDCERIGCLGNSYGGRTAMWSTIFDQRIKACVAAGCMNTFRERSTKLSSCGIQFFPGLLQYGDVPELFSLIAPRPLQLQSGLKDQLITASDRDEMLKVVKEGYKHTGQSENLDYYSHKGGHLLIWKAAEKFFNRYFKLRC